MPPGRATGPSSWDGYAATVVVARAASEALRTGAAAPSVSLHERPGFYAKAQ